MSVEIRAAKRYIYTRSTGVPPALMGSGAHGHFSPHRHACERQTWGLQWAGGGHRFLTHHAVRDSASQHSSARGQGKWQPVRERRAVGRRWVKIRAMAGECQMEERRACE